MGYVLPSGLFVPKQHDPELPDRRCNCCGERFPYEQRGAWRRHVVKCSDVNHDEIVAEMERRDDDPIIGTWDKEKREWFRQRRAEGST
jgi:hypothetical protein